MNLRPTRITDDWKDTAKGFFLWLVLTVIFTGIYLSSGCGATFPEMKPNVVFNNCQIIESPSDGSIQLKCNMNTGNEDGQVQKTDDSQE